jgi:hypothetical protein
LIEVGRIAMVKPEFSEVDLAGCNLALAIIRAKE